MKEFEGREREKQQDRREVMGVVRKVTGEERRGG